MRLKKNNSLCFAMGLLLLVLTGCDDPKTPPDQGAVSSENSTVESAPAFYDPQTQRFHSTITVTVRDASEHPLEGVDVGLSTDATSVLVQASTVSTDAEGSARFDVSGSQLGEHTIWVRAQQSGQDPVPLTDAVLAVEASLTLESAGEPSYVWDIGTFGLLMTLRDGAGLIASGTVVADHSGVSPQSNTTDASGQALVWVTTQERGTVELLFSLTGVEGSISAQAVLPAFGHGSVRPACQYAPDPGRTAYYEAPVVVAADWSEPVKVSAPLDDACPNDAISLSNDGQTLYFYWSPVVGGSNEQALHIHTGTYYAELTGAGPGSFTVPRFYDLNGGSGGSVDGALSFTPDGSEVIFHSTRGGNLGFQEDPPVDDFMDMYVSAVVDGVPGVAVNPGAPLNSIFLDGEHGLNTDGSVLYFSSDRPGGEGGIDIWCSEREGQSFGEPVNPGPPLNTAQWEGQPNFGPSEPDTMYFVSNRDGPSAIYRSVYHEGAWSEPQLLITGYVGEPAISPDGQVLYFVHVLVDDDGVYGSNIWYVVQN
ncbi:Ig-like domain-containing protein [Myxococcota bacterium]|nr:Ig-like domain-containing protein [Myxococcota bacterium]MBU1536683.1 Ig-like domain-containing protein [Myxococcota bacterium]